MLLSRKLCVVEICPDGLEDKIDRIEPSVTEVLALTCLETPHEFVARPDNS